MNRSAIRENAFKLIYSLEIQKEENIEEQIELFFESNEIKDDEAIVKLIADKFRHVTEKSKISPSDALKAALSSGITPDDTAAIPEGPEEPETAKGEPTNDE